MEPPAIDYFAVFLAAVASMIIGTIWYTAFGRIWGKAARLPPGTARATATAVATSFVCELLMALVFAILLGHFQNYTLGDALASAVFLWLGFVATTIVVGTRFQGFGWDLPLIDGGHWLFVLLAQGAVLGAFQ
ncbi:DUF1761 domain-containing protein [Jiella sp. M17.18]|uniref:DUF1761 domain-containing protein n=1 Tax=Jiella sp. M17.18 TaxID=3234247 RepID=UPI0034DEC78A